MTCGRSPVVPAASWVNAAHESTPHIIRAGVTTAELAWMSDMATPAWAWPRTRVRGPDPLVRESLLATTAKKEGVPPAGKARLAPQVDVAHGAPIKWPGLMKMKVAHGVF